MKKGDLRPLLRVKSPNLRTSLSTMKSMKSCLYCSMGLPFLEDVFLDSSVRGNPR